MSIGIKNGEIQKKRAGILTQHQQTEAAIERMAATGDPRGFFRDHEIEKGRDSRLFSNPQAMLLENMEKMQLGGGPTHFDGSLTPMISLAKHTGDTPNASPTHMRKSGVVHAQDAL